MNVTWTPLAEERAVQFIASMRSDRTGAAWRWLQALLARIRGLSRSPDGAAGAQLGEIHFDPCRIVYRIESDRLVILTIRAVGTHRKSARYEERPPGVPRAARDRS
jgi:ParE toxin of type II toxin-antitoxin system, parDE